ncbi:GH36-type glycosyl hydrolase domain-containing protein [Rhodoferax saidenbachensis]|uniref:Cellobiose phosphorylase n=1 Tax=Rhodoferax saidenbachensis TaxID=1484693 RepID=A0ABU1ZJR8_9BURK|nr:glucoamylase family protein [Rhodoferax saidenbachensis]MDR7305790.1 cellobiose phosphorylase [Rhodoferax saidenbachensis]
MKASYPDLRAAITRGIARVQTLAGGRNTVAAEAPLRAELFNAEQMERHGKTLAASHSLLRGRGREQLLDRLADNDDVLHEACDLLMDAVKTGRRITPAGEWLLDNFYLIEEQVLTARVHFPKGYSRGLPLLASGPSKGLPRVYDIALEVISHGDGRVDPENLNRFVAAYQKSSVLKLGELWAIPIMLRLALIENLRRISARVAQSMVERSLAATWAEQMMEVAERDPSSLILVIADMARSNPPLVNAFVAELARRLQGHSSALALPLTWIEQRLYESGQTTEQMVHAETQNQAINQVCMSNTIGSLRFLGAMDWREFVESMSMVDHKLREDPGGVYAQMDFHTRDRYRHAVEKIARRTHLSETDVARKAIQLAYQPVTSHASGDVRRSHVGYFLVDKGLAQLERASQAPLGLGESVVRLVRRFPVPVYLGGIGLLTAWFTWSLLVRAHGQGLNLWMLAGVGVATVLATSQLAVTLVNWLATLITVPRTLPRMDFSKGIAPSSRTLVVVPTMLNTGESIDALLQDLEVRYLANQDDCLHFGLLTDLLDATQESLESDAALEARVALGIAGLNAKYPRPGNDVFFLFHRPRCWNAQERLWMGYERKRGKLAALNALLRGGSAQAFSLVVGDTTVLQQVQYVITLDTDTQLPRDAARAFAGTLAHPLNRPHFDVDLQRVTEGYGILQPRMAVSLPGTNRSRYAQLCGNDPGMDPYTRAVSDVYQDLFHEGSFIGKGIYDVDAFERALNGRFPENRILSHDLLEGCYARAGLLSDVQLYDDYPTRYDADMQRRHRWTRGDWQIAAWLLSRVPGPGAQRVRNPLSRLSQWKIMDNLRRSLVPASVVGLLVLGWTQMVAFGPWTAALLGILFFEPALSTVVSLVRKPKGLSLGQHAMAVWQSTLRRLAQATLTLATLPYEAYFSLDAIGRTIARMQFTHRKLLEWSPSGASSSQSSRPGGVRDLVQTWATMWAGPVLALGLAVLLLNTRAMALWVAAPVLVLWLVSPVLAWWLSRPLPERSARFKPEQVQFLHTLARKTWRYFHTFVNAEENWLPPDNFQEHPVAVVAHRTSPTNMGLALLANLAAYDFGYIPTGGLLTRTADALRTMQTLERYEGHFYNWYDTLTLNPLAPRYISSVDSGNLSGHLLTLRAGLNGLADQPVLNPRLFDGLGHTLANLREALGTDVPFALSQAVTQVQTDIESACDAKPATVASARRWLETIAASCVALDQAVGQPAAGQVRPDLVAWSASLRAECEAHGAELDFLVPWKALPAGLPALPGLGAMATLRELAALQDTLSHALSQLPQDTRVADLLPQVALASQRARERIASLEALSAQATTLARANYALLYDTGRHLLTIGYNVDEHRRDAAHYDLLASEARLCSFLAIAQGDIPQDNWFALGRLLTVSGGEPTLLSWSGSMFEYLMPMLVMPTYANTLLDQTCQAVVKRQMAYAATRGVPWGISESGYNAVDAALNYQYRAFGVPGLGLKRGLAEDLVIAPYASAMALMVNPQAACQNLERLTAMGLKGDYGMYEAVDYTLARLPRAQSSAVVRSFMVHHQGMGFLAMAYVLLDQPMQQRFQADPMFRATDLLLQERTPGAVAFHVRNPEIADVRTLSTGPEMPMRVLRNTDTAIPEVQLLSNGRYHVMVSQAGGGYSRWKDIAVTRWREDGTTDHWGNFCYLRDVGTGEFWSTAHQPTLAKADSYEAIFSEGRAEFRRRDHDFETHTEIVVSPEDDMELRRLRITNRSRTRRFIEVTSYAEVVLGAAAADAAHPAFSNLFVQTEILQDRQAILCNRRPRSNGEHAPWMFHLMAVHGAESGAASYETDRMRFVGRTRGVDAPQAMEGMAALSNSQGAVLDPCVAIRKQILLEPQQTVTIDMVYGVADTRDAAQGLVGKYRDRHLADRVFDLAWTHSWVNLQQINASESDAQLYARLASSVIYVNPTQRADAVVQARNRRGQSGLWGYGISGDLPIVLLQIGSQANIELVRQLVQAHAYWRLKGLSVDLVIWNEDHAGYRQLLQEQIMGLIAAGMEANFTDRPGGIFVRAAEQISSEDRTLFLTVARVVITDTRGTLADQVNRRSTKEPREAQLARLPSGRVRRAEPMLSPNATAGERLFFNGLGGFSADGREYVITSRRGQTTPAPWVNVIANARFGTVISESGSAYTWSENAHEFRFTPWANDAVGDGSGEAIYLRDEETGAFWSPTLLPCGGPTPYVTRHGFGYSVFEHEEDGIHSALTVFVDLEAAIKFSVLKVRNQSGRARKLSATGYVEWVMGDLRSRAAMYISTEVEPTTGAILARNPYNPDFGDRVAFFDADGATRGANVSFTGDRREFLGRNRTLKNPAAMGRTQLSNRVGAGMDPCAALQVPFELVDGQEREIVFRLGATGRRGLDDATAMALHLREPQAVQGALQAVHTYWAHTLGAVQVQTPDPALNVLANGWLVYQTMACRLWARSGYYQSGGAFGFRDQLQDCMALVHTQPQLLREHIVRCAAHQFVDGDVQHWWHPPQGRGVRTHCSDDFLWLAQAVCRYVLATGERQVLEERIPFLEGRPVNPEDESYYDLPTPSTQVDTLYEHCVRAIRRGLPRGERGLPLMGAGDWNDGMNMVGHQGKGESVWLAFFQYDTLVRFSSLARAHGDQAFAQECLAEADQLRHAIDQHGWDGGWYRRAYFDDGTPLGSAQNTECQIDAVAQSWSVLSGAGDPARTRLAMDALDQRLVRRDDALIQLLTPPFDTSDLNPGYIKGYVPGVRENGGQYTHAAIWTAMAFAASGDARRAWECFDLINPVHHGSTAAAIATYKVEPYVVAADVYAVDPHRGRGGWTWYTGSASWMYRLVLESLLGVRLEAGLLHFAPCLPAGWPGFTLRYRCQSTMYAIVVNKVDGTQAGVRVWLDGEEQAAAAVMLVDDLQNHAVEVRVTHVVA